MIFIKSLLTFYPLLIRGGVAFAPLTICLPKGGLMEARMTYDKQKYAEDGFTHRSQNCSWDCWSWGTILGIGGGIVAVVVGSVLTAVAWFERAGSYAGTV